MHYRTYYDFALFYHPNEMPANLGEIILQRQDSNKFFVQDSTTNNNASSDSIHILKSIAGLHFMQINTDDTDKNTVIVELKTPHLL